MAVTGLAGRRNLDRLSAGIFPPDEVYANEPALLRIVIRNNRRFFPAFLLRIDLAGNRTLIPWIAPAGRAEVRLPALFPRRGEHPAPPLQISSLFPAGFILRGETVETGVQLLVFPELRPAAVPTTGKEAGESSRATPLQRRGLQGEIGRISDYTGSEPLKRIHWRLSARQAGLKVKEMEESAEPPVIVNPDEIPLADREARIAGAAWLVDRCSRSNRPVGLRLGKTEIPPAVGRGQRRRLLGLLAREG